MRISEFVETYDLHDSGLDEITVDKDNKIVRMRIDLCNWLQEDYVEGEPEIKPIELVFSVVTEMENTDRAIDEAFGDEFVSVDVEKDGVFHAELITATQEYYEIRIRAEDVRVFEREAKNVE